MEVKVGTTCLQWLQPIVPHSPSSSQTLASVISSPSSRRRVRGDGGPLVCRYVHRPDRSTFFGTKLPRSCSYEHPTWRILQEGALRRSCSASLESFSDEEFSKKIQELSLRFQLSDEDEEESNLESEAVSGGTSAGEGGFSEDSSNIHSAIDFVQNLEHFPPSKFDSVEPPWVEAVRREQSDWCCREEIIPASIERKANSFDLPLSLRIIKRKMKWQEGFREAGESAYCSVKKAFSSMVFIIRELQSYTLQMRELLFYEDLQGILVRVQKEMHASFVWLFQQVFSHTPTLMVYVMILLANFTVHSMGRSAAIAAPPPSPCASEAVFVVEDQDQTLQKFDPSSIKRYSVSSSAGKTTSVGGNKGGGGRSRHVTSGTDGDGRFDGSEQYRTLFPDGAYPLSSFGTAREAESASEMVTGEEEASLWNQVVEEASEMQAAVRDESLDRETIQSLISPVTAKIEPDDYEDYFRTELLYQTGLFQEPNNPLLLANYAQFLYLVARDYDRAEEYFKRATKVEPADAEAHSKYAQFLWRARKDLWAAEEAFLEAISAEPENSYHAANYAHFLWNTGGEDTCFPLGSQEEE